MQNLKTVAGLYSWAGQFESYLVANPRQVSRDKAQILIQFASHELDY